MFADYQEQVLNKYREELTSGRLSLRLTVPTAAKLKAECIAICQENYRKKDEQTLRLFFGMRGDKAGYLQAIRNCETDKFKPLINFLRRTTTATDSKNIELLAWLIGFEPRPYQFNFNTAAAADSNSPSVPDVKADPKDSVLSPVAQPDSTAAEAPKPSFTDGQQESSKAEVYETDGYTPVTIRPAAQQPQFSNTAARFKTAKAVLWITLPLLTAILIYFFRPASYQNTRLPVLLLSNTAQCMYWTGIHYQLTPCAQTHKHSPVLPVDTAQLLHFKLITQPDTITSASIRKIWYFRNKGRYEFYTKGGTHPIYRNRRLLPVTRHIFDKYILTLK